MEDFFYTHLIIHELSSSFNQPMRPLSLFLQKALSLPASHPSEKWRGLRFYLTSNSLSVIDFQRTQKVNKWKNNPWNKRRRTLFPLTVVASVGIYTGSPSSNSHRAARRASVDILHMVTVWDKTWVRETKLSVLSKKHACFLPKDKHVFITLDSNINKNNKNNETREWVSQLCPTRTIQSMEFSRPDYWSG